MRLRAGRADLSDCRAVGAQPGNSPVQALPVPVCGRVGLRRRGTKTLTEVSEILFVMAKC